ncbi:hypothetical protein NUW54_g3868 [Trametes sanguinea]|uniref:Uncharacterized protein n=1 Tax=Trametes sanguinea TaxID=158606 RepID=A0ACC1Q331_9APHY|nr:hypothetical protein NUW54_g3868 [Trametes sanguinea]
MLAGLYEDEAPGPGQQQEEPRASEPGSAPFDFLRLDTQLPLDLTSPLSHSPSTLSPSSPSEASSPASLLPATPPVSSPPMGSSTSSGPTSHSQSRNQQYKAIAITPTHGGHVIVVVFQPSHCIPGLCSNVDGSRIATHAGDDNANDTRPLFLIATALLLM